MLIAYLPKERLLFEADLFDTNQPRPAKPSAISEASTTP